MWSSAAPVVHVSIATFLKRLRFCPIRWITSSEGSLRDQMMRITSVYVPNLASIDPEAGLIVPLFHPGGIPGEITSPWAKTKGIRERGQLKIKLQRVDMVNAQAPYEYVLQVWV